MCEVSKIHDSKDEPVLVKIQDLENKPVLVKLNELEEAHLLPSVIGVGVAGILTYPLFLLEKASQFSQQGVIKSYRTILSNGKQPGVGHPLFRGMFFTVSRQMISLAATTKVYQFFDSQAEMVIKKAYDKGEKLYIPAWKIHLIGGLGAGLVAGAIHPLETLAGTQQRLSLSGSNPTLTQRWKVEGFSHLFKGVWAGCLQKLVSRTLVLSIFDSLRSRSNKVENDVNVNVRDKKNLAATNVSRNAIITNRSSDAIIDTITISDNIITNRSGDAIITNLSGDTIITNSSGDTIITNSSGDTIITNSSGDTIITNRSGKSTITNRSGKSTITNRSGKSTTTNNVFGQQTKKTEQMQKIEKLVQDLYASLVAGMVSSIVVQPLDFIKIRQSQNLPAFVGWNPLKYYRGFSVCVLRSVPYYFIAGMVAAKIVGSEDSKS